MSLHNLGLGDENARIPMTKPLLKLYEVSELLPAVLASSTPSSAPSVPPNLIF
jgi:hypothetical protein